MTRAVVTLLIFSVLTLAQRTNVTAEQTGPVETVDFNRDIRPILAENCLECHGRDEQTREADLRLDQRESALEALTADDSGSSELIQRVTSNDLEQRMPPPDTGKSLTRQQVETLRRWIQQGATYQEHWAFVPPERPKLPLVRRKPWPRNAIDTFVLQRLEQESLEPSPEADQRTLLRRLSFDLRGLPPTPAEVQRFVNDTKSDSYERIVDRWLASPAFGERFAQDWLDAARYADTTGHAADVPRTMWLFRDWVIKAINSNMPFDQFTTEQLAGDMLPGATVDQRIATGFHRNSMQALGNNPRKEEYRVQGIVDRLDTTGRVWLGLTIACAECHEHKYDPISQEEYYELFALFNNVPHLGERFGVHGPRMEVTVDSDQKQQQMTAQVMEEMEQPRTTHVLIRGNYLNAGEKVVPSVPAILPPLPPDEPANRLTFARWLVSDSHPLTARVVVNRYWQHYFGTGLVQTVDDFGVRGSPASHPQLLDWLATEFVSSGWNVKALQRLIVTSATYRQDSRNADWGLGTADSPIADFGLRIADSESNPQSGHPRQWVIRNPQFLGRGPRFRLAAEQIRDNALAVSGLLVRRVGGASVYPVQPAVVGQFRDASAGTWATSHGGDRYRRGIYTFWQRMSPYPSLATFDATTRERCTVQRSITNTPLQVLVTLNDPVFVEMSVAFAERIITEALQPDTDRRLDYAFQVCLSRPPTTAERKTFVRFYANQLRRYHTDQQAALELIAGYSEAKGTRASELAAWSMVAQVVLNLDETITKE